MSRKTTDKSGNGKFDISLYVIGIFFYQGVALSLNLYNNTHIIIAPFWEIPGGTCKSNRLVIRLGAGAWCLVALVLGVLGVQLDAHYLRHIAKQSAASQLHQGCGS